MKGEFRKARRKKLCVTLFPKLLMEELRLNHHVLQLDLKANKIMAENKSEKKEVVALDNARLPAETPRSLKGATGSYAELPHRKRGFLRLRQVGFHSNHQKQFHK